jgi:3-hydroxymyristoyl/3-hydroxydecanoyl-(acyl carrier protein) dehydratase
MPGVLVAEALAQTSGLLLGLTSLVEQTRPPEYGPNLYLAHTDIKFLSPAEPRETLHLQSKLKKAFGRLYLFEVAARVKNRLIATGSLALGKSA